jgi:sorbitol-specific phosphotransferase system component IIBC
LEEKVKEIVVDQLHPLWFIECNVGLADNIWCDLALVHDLLHQGIVDWPDVIGVIIGLQDGVQDGVTHVERRMLFALLQDFTKDSVPLLFPEDAFEGRGNEDQQLKNLD